MIKPNTSRTAGASIYKDMANPPSNRKFDRVLLCDLLIEHSTTGGTIHDFSYFLVKEKAWDPKQVPTRQLWLIWKQSDPHVKEVLEYCEDLAHGFHVRTIREASVGILKTPYHQKAHDRYMTNIFHWRQRIEHSGQVSSDPKPSDILDQMASNPELEKKGRELAELLANTLYNKQPEPEKVEPIGEEKNGENITPDNPEGQ